MAIKPTKTKTQTKSSKIEVVKKNTTKKVETPSPKSNKVAKKVVKEKSTVKKPTKKVVTTKTKKWEDDIEDNFHQIPEATIKPKKGKKNNDDFDFDDDFDLDDDFNLDRDFDDNY